MKRKVALVATAFLMFASLPVSSAGAADLDIEKKVIHTELGDFEVFYIEEDILIEVPASVNSLSATAFEELDELIGQIEDVGGTCDGLKTTESGDSGNNSMSGTSNPDIMNGHAGDDSVDALGGIDRVCGGRGNDIVRGGAGEDKVIGGKGHDEVRGGSGVDNLIGSSGNDDAYDGFGADMIDLVDSVTGDQLYRCLDNEQDTWVTDDDEIEVQDVAASSIYC